MVKRCHESKLGSFWPDDVLCHANNKLPFDSEPNQIHIPEKLVDADDDDWGSEKVGILNDHGEGSDE